MTTTAIVMFAVHIVVNILRWLFPKLPTPPADMLTPPAPMRDQL